MTVYGTNETEPNGGHHSDLIVSLAKFLRPSLYVEIGVEWAETFNKVAPFCYRAYGVDIEDRASFVDESHMGEFVQADSKEWLKGLPDDEIDLAFIDGDHRHYGVAGDFAAIQPKMKAHGILVFHDIYPANQRHLSPSLCGDAWRMAEDVAAAGWQTVGLCSQHGLLVCQRKRFCGPLWMRGADGEDSSGT